MSLNNRISIRDSHEARKGVVGCQVVTVPRSARVEATKGTTTPEAEKTQEEMIKPLVAEGEVEETVDSECVVIVMSSTALLYLEQVPQMQTLCDAGYT